MLPSIRNTHTANHNNNKAEHSSNVPYRYIYSYYKRKTITTFVNTVMQQSILQKVQENKSEDMTVKCIQGFIQLHLTFSLY